MAMWKALRRWQKNPPKQQHIDLLRLHVKRQEFYATYVGRGIGWLLVGNGTTLVAALTLVENLWKNRRLHELRLA